jgi:proteasome assembly chaperone (PAC2) family protein
VGDLEALKAIAAFSLFSNDIEDRIDEFGALSVMTFGPVVTSTSLTEDEVVGSEELTEGTSTDGVHGSGLEVHQHRAGHLAAASRLVVLDVDALQLQVAVTARGAGRVDAVLVRDHLPELGADLVPALPALDVHELAHD